MELCASARPTSLEGKVTLSCTDMIPALVWLESKRPSESGKEARSGREAEKQVQDLARRCIEKEGLLWIYAMTSVGTTFRLWRVDKGNLELKLEP